MADQAKEGMKLNVLDHGYVQYVEHWGSDERIIESARMSTGKGFQGWDTVGMFVAQRFPRTWELFAKANHGG